MELNEEQGHPANELTISGDGSWAKRSFSSPHVCTPWTGKTDTDELAVWHKEHEDHYDANHEGSSDVQPYGDDFYEKSKIRITENKR
ncbi:hypothetical protein PV325_009063 [Microctonus aethiopoides]|nr:hypothetical protein PV325_009063 [Microctonus aethiopoides]KAK0076947.1 hypothetical protein PV326_010420 [Microctonus aethiopoides]